MMFQEQPLFGGASPVNREMSAKVVVAGTTALEQKPVIFANYNRQDRMDTSAFTQPRQTKVTC